MKPALADDIVPEWLQFPCGVQPKIDGVRGINFAGTFTGRSLDPFPGTGVTRYFSRPELIGLDGEITLGPDPCASGLCNSTHGALGKFKGVTEMQDFHWWLFDYVTPATVMLSYGNRYELLKDRFSQIDDPRIHLIPMIVVNSPAMVNKMMNRWVDQGYEGLIARNLSSRYKEGRPNKGIWQLGRMKPWATAEMLVEELIEGEKNNNPQKRNSLGKAERSSAKAGKVPNGMIGSIRGPLIADLIHPYTKKVLLPKGHKVIVSRGEMSASQASLWFHNPQHIVGHIVTFQYMPHGMVNELRMATFKSKRLPQDLS